MTAAPHGSHGWVRVPLPPVTLAEFDAMHEDNSALYEVKDGVLIVSPRAATPHQAALFELAYQLRQQLPDDVRFWLDVEVLLAEEPLRLRVPDLVVATSDADPNAQRHPAAHISVAVEIVSPTSRTVDRRDKFEEYGAAGIPYYWIVDTDTPVSLSAYHLTEEFGYQQSVEGTGLVKLAEPFPVQLDLDKLLR